MALFLFGQEQVEFILKLNALMKKTPELLSDVSYYEKSRRDQILEWWRRIRIVIESKDLNYAITKYHLEKQQTFAWSFFLPGTVPIALHQTMFIDCL